VAEAVGGGAGDDEEEVAEAVQVAQGLAADGLGARRVTA
jgi:hypothetical protein